MVAYCWLLDPGFVLGFNLDCVLLLDFVLCVMFVWVFCFVLFALRVASRLGFSWAVGLLYVNVGCFGYKAYVCCGVYLILIVLMYVFLSYHCWARGFISVTFWVLVCDLDAWYGYFWLVVGFGCRWGLGWGLACFDLCLWVTGGLSPFGLGWVFVVVVFLFGLVCLPILGGWDFLGGLPCFPWVGGGLI